MPAPVTLYRLRCGRKIWTSWLPSPLAALQAGVPLGLAYTDERLGQINPGPLTWIEKGTRRYAKSKTVPVPRHPL